MILETIYRQLGASKLSPELRELKNQKDFEYKEAVEKLSNPFYQKKHSVGVTIEEEETYKQQKSQLWNTYKTWAISQGLYEEVTPEQQLTEAETELNGQVDRVNLIRQELGLRLIEAKERTVEV